MSLNFYLLPILNAYKTEDKNISVFISVLIYIKICHNGERSVWANLFSLTVVSVAYHKNALFIYVFIYLFIYLFIYFRLKKVYVEVIYRIEIFL